MTKVPLEYRSRNIHAADQRRGSGSCVVLWLSSIRAHCARALRLHRAFDPNEPRQRHKVVKAYDKDVQPSAQEGLRKSAQPLSSTLEIFIAMSSRFGKYRVLTPEFCMGEAIGRLSNIGAWLDGQNKENDLIAILARVPIQNMPPYEQWLIEQ